MSKRGNYRPGQLEKIMQQAAANPHIKIEDKPKQWVNPYSGQPVKLAPDPDPVVLVRTAPSPEDSMNKTELRYWRILQAETRRGIWTEIAYEPFAFPIGHKCTYTPDFITIPAGSHVSVDELKELFEASAAETVDSDRLGKILTKIRIHGREVAICHETKGGYIREDARVKFRVTARKYSWLQWRLMQWKDGEWNNLNDL